ncbi:MAG: hypothetical protein KDC84_16315, partial [Crocinitomicaceae bacterium]|nr:hypothetical protein [Crocinitomicaceae bacterium]
MIEIRNKIKNIVSNIIPFDALESNHASEVIDWIESGEEIFRVEKPDIPNKHLVSYFCLYYKVAK